jgi:hypothetical protein
MPQIQPLSVLADKHGVSYQHRSTTGHFYNSAQNASLSPQLKDELSPVQTQPGQKTKHCRGKHFWVKTIHASQGVNQSKAVYLVLDEIFR